MLMDKRSWAVIVTTHPLKRRDYPKKGKPGTVAAHVRTLPSGLIYCQFTGPNKNIKKLVRHWKKRGRKYHTGNTSEGLHETFKRVEKMETLFIPSKEEKDRILNDAKALISGDRLEAYGGARDSFKRIGDLWSVVFGKPVTPKDVALCMVLFKAARQINKYHRDNLVDMAGYAALIGQINQEEMGEIAGVSIGGKKIPVSSIQFEMGDHFKYEKSIKKTNKLAKVRKGKK